MSPSVAGFPTSEPQKSRRAGLSWPYGTTAKSEIRGKGYARYDVGTDGTLLYTRGGDSDQRSLVWVDRNGIEEPVEMTPRAFDSLTLSPDGKQLVVSVGGVLEGGNLYRYDLEQVTFSGADMRPLWSPDGSQIVFGSKRDGQENLYIMAADGTATRLAESPMLQAASDWFPDGERLLVIEVDNVTGVDVATLRIGSGGPSEKLLQTDANESQPAISPNGGWMAYTSDESGQVQIYVRPFPDVTSGSRRLIGPGTIPVWGPEGRDLFYLSSEALMVVDVETGETFERGTPRQLFPYTYYFSGSRNWVLGPDGRYLMITRGSATSASPEIIVRSELALGAARACAHPVSANPPRRTSGRRGRGRSSRNFQEKPCAVWQTSAGTERRGRRTIGAVKTAELADPARAWLSE